MDISISSDLPYLGGMLTTLSHSGHFKINLGAWLLLVVLVCMNWMTTNTTDSTQMIVTLAVLACLKFFIIYFVFMETYRAHFLWVAFGFVYSIAVAGLFAFQI